MPEYLSQNIVVVGVGLIALTIAFVIWLEINEIRDRGPIVGEWQAQYTENIDGSGKRIHQSGIFYQNRGRTVPPTIYINGDLDIYFWICTKIPRWKQVTYYLDPNTIKMSER